MPDKKTAKQIRHRYALIVGATHSTTLGNQTITDISDPISGRDFSVKLIWELQGKDQIAAPYMIQITAEKVDPMNSADIERRLGNSQTSSNYPISSTLIRRIPFEKITDASRQVLIQNNIFYSQHNVALVHEIDSEKLQTPRKPGRPFDRSDSFYLEVAKRYKEAKSLGGSVARKPAKHIQGFVMDEIQHLPYKNQLVQIRKWVAEARKRGYLPTAERS